MSAPSEQSPPAIVDVRNISKWYGALRVLNDVSLRVTPGQKLVICGPSGSGKSTFIRCLNRLEAHQQGEIFIDGVELHRKMTGIENVRRNVGMVFQNFNLFPHMTVMENLIAAPIRVLRENPRIARDRAEELLQRVRRVVLCSGKVFYDIKKERDDRGIKDIAILRLEQLYPFPRKALGEELAKYPNARVKWVQDEPFNQGPWPSYHLNVVPQLGREIEPVTRKASSTTAVGTAKRHLEEAKVLIGEAFA